MVRAIVGWFARLPGMAVAALASLPGAIAGIAADGARRMTSNVSTGVSNAVSAIRGLPSRARSALGGLGGALYSSGQSLIQGFIDGIKSMIGAAAGAAESIVGKVSDFFPHSPAQEGPFSGSGWTLYSGRALGDGLAQGMADRQSTVASAAALLGSARVGLPGVGGVGAGGFTGGGGMEASGGRQTVHVVLEVQGGNDGFVRAIREAVKVKGRGGPNSVQTAFG